jgi:hypothetical protein
MRRADSGRAGSLVTGAATAGGCQLDGGQTAITSEISSEWQELQSVVVLRPVADHTCTRAATAGGASSQRVSRSFRLGLRPTNRIRSCISVLDLSLEPIRGLRSTIELLRSPLGPRLRRQLEDSLAGIVHDVCVTSPAGVRAGSDRPALYRCALGSLGEVNGILRVAVAFGWLAEAPPAAARARLGGIPVWPSAPLICRRQGSVQRARSTYERIAPLRLDR